MLEWTKEDIEFVAKNIVMPIITTFEEEVNEKRSDGILNIIKTMTEALANRIAKLEYELQRDKSYYEAVISQMYHCDREPVKEAYKRYIAEFDKFNKDKLEAVLSDPKAEEDKADE